MAKTETLETLDIWDLSGTIDDVLKTLQTVKAVHGSNIRLKPSEKYFSQVNDACVPLFEVNREQ